MNANRQNERGSALIYILIAIALLAALTIAFMGSSNQQTQSQNSFRLVSELQSQVEFIRSSIQECVLAHPKGDITIDRSPTGTDPDADHRYPIKPNSTHFTGATIGPAGGRLVKDLRCPGNPGDSKEHAPLFGGASAKYLPPPPALFDAWQWYNGEDGVYFWISTPKTDSYIRSAFEKLNESFSTCEADEIDATSSAKPLDSNGDTECPASHLCFRIWLKANMSTAVFPDESADCHS